MKDELVFYRPNEINDPIEVMLDEETVWLTQKQMALLFMQTKQNISLHIVNCFKEKELDPMAVVKDSLTTELEREKKSSNPCSLRLPTAGRASLLCSLPRSIAGRS